MNAAQGKGIAVEKACNLLWIVVCLLAFPALAKAGTTACDLLTKADVEAVTGIQVTETKLESLNLCAGFCETTTGTRCIYVGTLAGAQHAVYLAEELPPYMVRDVIGVDETTAKPAKDVQTTRMQVLGRPGLWFFAGSYAYLHIVDGNEVHFLIWEDGITQNDIALQHALAMAARVYERYKVQ